jgi:hypothetical protein
VSSLVYDYAECHSQNVVGIFVAVIGSFFYNKLLTVVAPSLIKEDSDNMLFHLECAIIFEGTLKFMETPRHTMHFLVITGNK